MPDAENHLAQGVRPLANTSVADMDDVGTLNVLLDKSNILYRLLDSKLK